MYNVMISRDSNRKEVNVMQTVNKQADTNAISRLKKPFLELIALLNSSDFHLLCCVP